MRTLFSLLLLVSVGVWLCPLAAKAAEPKDVQQVIDMIRDKAIPANDRQITDDYEGAVFVLDDGFYTVMYTKNDIQPKLSIIYISNRLPLECVRIVKVDEMDILCTLVVDDHLLDGTVTEGYVSGDGTKRDHYRIAGVPLTVGQSTETIGAEEYDRWQNEYNRFIQALIAYKNSHTI